QRTIDGSGRMARRADADEQGQARDARRRVAVAADRHGRQVHAEDAGDGGEAAGKVILGKGGRLDLGEGKGALCCSYRFEKDGRLTLVVWPDAAARERGGDALKAGAILLLMEKATGKKT